MICATLVDPKFDFKIYILTHTLAKWVKPVVNQLVQSCEMHLRCKFGDSKSVNCKDNTHIIISDDDLKTK